MTIPTILDRSDIRVVAAKARAFSGEEHLSPEIIQIAVNSYQRLRNTAGKSVARTRAAGILLEAATLIRDRLALEGIAIIDNISGTTWERVKVLEGPKEP